MKKTDLKNLIRKILKEQMGAPLATMKAPKMGEQSMNSKEGLFLQIDGGTPIPINSPRDLAKHLPGIDQMGAQFMMENVDRLTCDENINEQTVATNILRPGQSKKAGAQCNKCGGALLGACLSKNACLGIFPGNK